MISAWSGSKKRFFIFDLDQKSAIFFLIWIKKTPFHFWSGSKNLFFIFDPGSKNIHFWIKDHEIKKWSTVLIHDLPTVNKYTMLSLMTSFLFRRKKNPKSTKGTECWKHSFCLLLDEGEGLGEEKDIYQFTGLVFQGLWVWFSCWRFAVSSFSEFGPQPQPQPLLQPQTANITATWPQCGFCLAVFLLLGF